MSKVGYYNSKLQQSVGGWPGKHVTYLYVFEQRLRMRGYPKKIIERSLSEVDFASRPSAVMQKKKANERILPFVICYHPAVSSLKQIGSYKKPAFAENNSIWELR